MSRLLRGVVLASVVGAVLLPSFSASAAQQVGPAVDLGDVSIVKGSDPSSPVRNGKADSEFRVLLPSGSTCPGDSATGQWRVQTFMVPVGVDPGTLKYSGAGPEGTDQFPLYTADAAQHSWVNKVLPLNTSTDPATTIPALPIFSFSAISVVKVTEGSYRVGVACTLFGATAQYWDTVVDVTGSSLGNPASFRFTVPGAPAPPARSGPPVWVVVAISAFGLLGGAALVAALRRARLSSSNELSRKEHR